LIERVKDGKTSGGGDNLAAWLRRIQQAFNVVNIGSGATRKPAVIAFALTSSAAARLFQCIDLRSRQGRDQTSILNSAPSGVFRTLSVPPMFFFMHQILWLTQTISELPALRFKFGCDFQLNIFT
jgi:hypothetical protein